MSIIGVIIDELSDYKSNVESNISNQSEEIIEHLIKIYLWRDTEYKNHWISELNGFLHSVQKIKRVSGKDRFPDNKDIYKWLWKDNGTKFDKILDNILDDVEQNEKGYENLREPKNFDKNDIKNFIKEYVMWISLELSKSGIVSKREIRESIYFLLEKHQYR